MARNLLLTLLACLGLASLHAQNPHLFAQSYPSTLVTDPPNQYNDYFAGAGACLQCHNTQVNEQGASVAIVNDWRSTMMANSSKDPFWQAKVSHEILVNPQYANEIQTVCTRCHAPMGNINALNNGADHYTLEEMRADALGMDGASCTVCHQITAASMGNSSGNFLIGNKQIYGPYPTPFSNPMISNTGYTPVYSQHIRDSRVCQSCHTLITNPLDLNGVPTGGEFVEQSPYEEWKNSDYPGEGTSCTTCHLPEIQDVVKISSMPPFLDGRTPYGLHHLVGGNVFMLKLLRNNIDELGITADDVQFDSTLARTYQNLQLKSLELNLTETSRTNDTLYINMQLTNLAGHKLPTSYPSRRLYVELFAINQAGDTIFHSGKTDQHFNLIAENADFEQHYNLINRADQVQIYEMVMGDVNGDLTTVLERAAIHLKDNRIPPKGFTTSHPGYDTTKIVGQALNDQDFNKSDNIQGTGSDIIHYHIPIENYAEDISITGRVYYQTVSNKWLEHMFSYTSFEIDRFKTMYEETDKTPVLMGSQSLVSLFTQTPTSNDISIRIFPNPSHGNLTIESKWEVLSYEIYTVDGTLIEKSENPNQDLRRLTISMSGHAGLHFLVLHGAEQKFIGKVLIY